ncbi:MAG: anthranilate synthase component I [Gammaproteobacteria bacterium]|nr:anthranilate synthase component I [Gammaproteobacteria bacterium]MYD75528.1 anthranilate synthase component I [Gammaproteobacteria bacterium]MYJ52085.1 anthranilate synthase component I [Gammaproteobacteria bacterium]
MLDKTQFQALGEQGYNCVPLIRELLADFDTPLSTYLKLADEPWTYLLESVEGGEKWGRYSIIGLACSRRLEIRGHVVRIIDDAGVTEFSSDDPLKEVRKFKALYASPDLYGEPRFTGGLVGYFGYSTISYIEPHLGANPVPDPLETPDILLLASSEVVVFDNLRGRMYLVVHADPNDEDAWETGHLRLNTLIDRLREPLPRQRAATDSTDPPQKPDCQYYFPEKQYVEAVEKCKRYIYDGDAFQIVLSQRLALDYPGRPVDLYRALRTLNPSPYMYYFNLGDFHIAGSSPEILVRLEDGMITLRPIAGTRHRGQTEQEDAGLAAELLADPKELAEHLMLIDLGRNDVGRVSVTGSVSVTDMMTIERYSHVMHIVSNVTGRIKKELDAVDVLRATFPAGTLSGAPKVRALEIIEELEPHRRGIYSGAIGYIGWNGNMDTAIAIRTAVIKDNQAHIQAGGGIVADSKPLAEWQESMNKARAVLRAADMVNAGLDKPLELEVPAAPDMSGRPQNGEACHSSRPRKETRP